MKVSELIDQLQKHAPDLDVHLEMAEAQAAEEDPQPIEEIYVVADRCVVVLSACGRMDI